MNKPHRISGLYELESMAKAKKAVVVPGSSGFEKPKPAAFIINLSGAVLLRLFRMGVYLYTPKVKK